MLSEDLDSKAISASSSKWRWLFRMRGVFRCIQTEGLRIANYFRILITDWKKLVPFDKFKILWTFKNYCSRSKIWSLDACGGKPLIKFQALAVRSGVSRLLALRILHQETLYPYHLLSVRNLLEVDLLSRLQFSHLCHLRHIDGPCFVNSVLFIDEAIIGLPSKRI